MNKEKRDAEGIEQLKEKITRTLGEKEMYKSRRILADIIRQTGKKDQTSEKYLRKLQKTKVK